MKHHSDFGSVMGWADSGIVAAVDIWNRKKPTACKSSKAKVDLRRTSMPVQSNAEYLDAADELDILLLFKDRGVEEKFIKAATGRYLKVLVPMVLIWSLNNVVVKILLGYRTLSTSYPLHIYYIHGVQMILPSIAAIVILILSLIWKCDPNRVRPTIVHGIFYLWCLSGIGIQCFLNGAQNSEVPSLVALVCSFNIITGLPWFVHGLLACICIAIYVVARIYFSHDPLCLTPLVESTYNIMKDQVNVEGTLPVDWLKTGPYTPVAHSLMTIASFPIAIIIAYIMESNRRAEYRTWRISRNFNSYLHNILLTDLPQNKGSIDTSAGNHGPRDALTTTNEFAYTLRTYRCVYDRTVSALVDEGLFFESVLSSLRHELSSLRRGVTAVVSDTDMNDREDRVRQFSNQVNHLTEFVRKALDLVSLATSAQSSKLIPIEFSPRGVAGAVAASFYDEISEQKLVLNCDCEKVPVGIKVIADVERIQEILLILLDNAVKATSEGDKITLQLVLSKKISSCKRKIRNFSKHYNSTLIMTVSDTGTGISDEKQERLFKPFVADCKPPRLELGLTICAINARLLHCGPIEIFSNQGEGSTFTVHIPVTSAL